MSALSSLHNDRASRVRETHHLLKHSNRTPTSSRTSVSPEPSMVRFTHPTLLGSGHTLEQIHDSAVRGVARSTDQKFLARSRHRNAEGVFGLWRRICDR